MAWQWLGNLFHHAPKSAMVFRSQMKPLSFSIVVLWLAVLTPSPASDVGLFGVIKSSEYVQTNASAPSGRPTNGFAFNAFVIANSNHVVSAATVKPSNATPLRTLLATDTNDASWRFEERFASQALLDATYPYGNFITPINYTVTMNTAHDGVRAVNLNYSLLPVVGGVPSVPQITNFAAAQAVDHTANFTLRFNSSGNSVIDLVQVIITDASSNVLFSSPAPFATGALTGASNAVVIPGYRLPANAQLIGHLSFARPVFIETNAYPGAVGVAAVLRDTEFPLVTRPAPVPPHLTVISMDSAPFQFRYTGESNRVYHIQGTDDLIHWMDLWVTNLATAVYTDARSDLYPWRFYRVQVGP
jgi:hypothetical protein